MKSPFLLKIKKRVQDRSREDKLNHFYSMYKDGMTVLDVGVFPEPSNPKAPKSVNFFTKSFRYDSSLYTGLGLQYMEEMKQLYPGKNFVEYPGDYFPFQDKEFDWVFCNAVIEHVGNDQAQLLFIKEMVRVSKNVYFTTPNKFFPVDAHTMVFFIHWSDRWFYNWREKKKKWLPKDALNLISRGKLKKLLNESKAEKYKIILNYLLLMPMTFTVIINEDSVNQ